ncbi:YceI family protein [Bordetella sp. 15P40C-2]|uniref:YceI family protein n=1 Tax=Bordetella sp. 15P40C-2 TaxID=2572246 RepID=UPI00132649E1|nr:YceI family protein [Bordetella sp. 15P40C-2]MVW69906.1 polyisoprenoid-binding protein [Bordetella sp. 15P40C-2]
MKIVLPLMLYAVLSSSALAAPVTYDIDPSHTYPSFEADHMGGLSTWRGKFNKTSGVIVLDREARSGTIDITVDIDSIDFGHDEMNAHAKAPDIFDAAKYPTATFKGRFTEFDGDRPKTAKGDFTLRGVTRPLELEIDDFKCIDHPMEKREACGADVSGSFNRGDYGLNFALDMGFKPEVELEIQVEALRRP